MTTTPNPGYTLGPDWTDDQAKSTGTSLAYAVARNAIAQVLHHLNPDMSQNKRDEAAHDLAYKVALQHREIQPLPMVAGIAVSAAFLQHNPDPGTNTET